MNDLERFLAVMEYQPVDRVPNWEVGTWIETRDRWRQEGLDTHAYHWEWPDGEEALEMDKRESIRYYWGLLPTFKEQILTEDDRTTTFRDGQGIVCQRFKAGTSMDRYIDFPVHQLADWQALKPRLKCCQERYQPDIWDTHIRGWQSRNHPLIFGQPLPGFYWRARELMGIEGLSYALHDQPALVHDIMVTNADFLIEAARPLLQQTTLEYALIAEDLSMKNGPLISPEQYRTFVYPRLRRVIDFYKSHGVRYVSIDSDGNPEALIPMMLDAGVDAILPPSSPCPGAANRRRWFHPHSRPSGAT